MSPFLLTNLPPPAMATMAAPGNGPIQKLSADPHLRLFTMGAALLMVAAGLVLGISSPTEPR
jgi:hypothetical protein